MWEAELDVPGLSQNLKAQVKPIIPIKPFPEASRMDGRIWYHPISQLWRLSSLDPWRPSARLQFPTITRYVPQAPAAHHLSTPQRSQPAELPDRSLTQKSPAQTQQRPPLAIRDNPPVAYTIPADNPLPSRHHERKSARPYISRAEADISAQFAPINPRPMLQDLYVHVDIPASKLALQHIPKESAELTAPGSTRILSCV